MMIWFVVQVPDGNKDKKAKACYIEIQVASRKQPQWQENHNSMFSTRIEEIMRWYYKKNIAHQQF